MKETVLKRLHESLGARLVPFGGWTMPVQYSGILEEARAVRSAAGLFDLGHMGRVSVLGRDAEAYLQRLQTNDAAAIAPGRIRYAMLLDDQGRTQDDILVYREPEGHTGFLVVVNAGNAERDFAIMHRVAADFDDVQLVDRSTELAMIAVQGPRSEAIVQRVTDVDLRTVRYYGWARGRVGDTPGALSRTGYTGEDGFELYVPAAQAEGLWRRLTELGAGDGLIPCGLGSRDVLRLEAGMPLYGHEIDEQTTPLDAGLDFGVKFTHDFIGRAALERQLAAGGPQTRLVGLTTDSRRVPRQGYSVWSGDREIGRICSGTASPTLGTNIATAHVPVEFAEPGTELQFDVRGSREPARVVTLPFYKRAR
ncbi:MAG: glycine cleavage system aminomethyltransferase GcvT [Planctomycetes bacterium]|nr:glycine cleavage system aminomethyltransferase GcvT [Planctomycetota bacterium]